MSVDSELSGTTPQPDGADAQPPQRRDRGPSIALFVGGLLSGAAIIVLGLALTGVLGPTGGQATASQPAAGGAGAAGALGGFPGPLVTLPPIASPTETTPADLADGNALGAADAPVTVEVWADYQCPYCAAFTAQIEPQIVRLYVETGQVRLVFRDLAFLGEESRWAAVAARLAEEQGAFWPYHDYLFANQQRENVGGFALDRLREIAGQVGLDMAAFDAGTQLEEARGVFAEIWAEFEADAGALGIRSTPSVVVNGTRLEAYDWATIKAAIDEALAG